MGEQRIQNRLLVHDPTEHHMVDLRAAQEAREQMNDVVHDHGFRLFRDAEGMQIPAPVAVQKRTALKQRLKLFRGGCLAHAHRPADQKQALAAWQLLRQAQGECALGEGVRRFAGIIRQRRKAQSQEQRGAGSVDAVAGRQNSPHAAI